MKRQTVFLPQQHRLLFLGLDVAPLFPDGTRRLPPWATARTRSSALPPGARFQCRRTPRVHAHARTRTGPAAVTAVSQCPPRALLLLRPSAPRLIGLLSSALQSCAPVDCGDGGRRGAKQSQAGAASYVGRAFPWSPQPVYGGSPVSSWRWLSLGIGGTTLS